MSRAFAYTLILAALITSLAFGGTRLVTQPDVAWGPSTTNETPTGGHVGGKIPRYFSTAAFTDNLALYGKSLTGDGTGNISGFDNATFTGRVTTATLTVTGTPTFTDNTINGADLIDNTVTKGKLNYTPGGYALHFGSTSFNPADGATYYFGFITGQPLTTIPAIRRIYIPKSGTIKSANVVGWNNAEVGTTEAWPMYIVIDNTTSVLIQSVSDNNVPRVWDNTAINIDVTAGSYFEIKTICPTWSTNPLEYNIGGNIYIE